MRAMVIYDSLYGNTARIAQAIGEDISAEVRPITEAETIPADLDLLVIGGPTQGHGVDQPLKEYLARLPDEIVDGVSVAVFDTRLRWPALLSGSAAKGLAKLLEAKGAQIITEPASFFVDGKEGPLSSGELERSASWARQLNAILAVKA